MRTVLNLAVCATLLCLVGVNLAMNPFVPSAYAQYTECEGEPSSPNCECCTECGCWICPEE